MSTFFLSAAMSARIACNAARAVTPKDGHVIAFDAAATPDGGAAVVYRDDDTPSGSAGGRVMRVSVSLAQVGAPVVLVEESAGAGMPVQLREVLDDLRLGRTSVHVALEDLPSLADRLGRRLFSGVVVAALILSGALMLMRPGREAHAGRRGLAATGAEGVSALSHNLRGGKSSR